MKLLTLLSTLTLLALPIVCSAQAAGGAAQSGLGGHEPAEDLLTRNSLSQSELKRLTEKIDQWNRVEGIGVKPRVAKMRTAAMLSVLNVSCEVSDAAYRGTAPDDAQQRVYEAACKDSMGYLLFLQGSSLRGISCLSAERDKSAVKCALPANSASKVMADSAPSAPETSADSRPTLSWFKDALSRNGVSCQSKRARIVGRESIKRRYLVEFECSDRPDGLVAFVPPAGDTVNSFESMNCPSAAERGIRCEWVSNVGQ